LYRVYRAFVARTIDAVLERNGWLAEFVTAIEQVCKAGDRARCHE